MAQNQAVVSSSDSATSAPITLSATGASRTLIYAVWLTAGAPTTLVDSAGGTLAGGQWVSVGAAGPWYIYHRLNAPAGITSVTASFAAAGYLTYCCERDDLVSFDKLGAITDSGGSVSSWASGSTGTLSFANEVCFGFAATFSGAAQGPSATGSWSAGTGTGITSGAWATGGGLQAFVETQTVSATTALQATGAWSVASYTYAIAVTYRQQTGGGGGAGSRNRLLLGVG